MRSIVMQRSFSDSSLREFGVGASVIGVRTHDMGGTDFEPWLRMSGRFAEGLVAGIPGLSWRHARALEAPREIQPMTAVIDMRDDPDLQKRNFVLLAGEEGSEERHIVGYLSKEQADEMVRELNIPYIGPEKSEYDRIMTRLQIADLRARADALEASLEEDATPSP